eukprot:g8990.t1
MWQGTPLFRACTLSSSLRSFPDYKESELQNSSLSAVRPDGALWDHETLQLRVNPPTIEIDNQSSEDSTVISLSSANRPGTLLEVLTCFTELCLFVKSARISSERGWFVDDFHVTEANGEKVTDPCKIEKMRKILCINPSTNEPEDHTGVETIVLEMSGLDRPGLLADITDLLIRNDYDVKSAAVWTHQQKVAFVMNIIDLNNGLNSSPRLNPICQRLKNMLGGPLDYAVVSPSKCRGHVHHELRLHLMLLREEDKQWQQQKQLNIKENENHNSSTVVDDLMPCKYRSPKLGKPNVSIQPWPRLGYWLINIQCKDRRKLLFDTVCTLTDLDFDIYHGSVESKAHLAVIELYVRPRFQHLECIKDRMAEVRYFLEAAIIRRYPNGLKVHVHPFEDPGCLSGLLQELKSENICVTRAKVSSDDGDGKPMHTVYLMKSNGSPPEQSIVEAACRRVGGRLIMTDDQTCNSDSCEEDSFPNPKFAFCLKDRRGDYDWNGKPRSV